LAPKVKKKRKRKRKRRRRIKKDKYFEGSLSIYVRNSVTVLIK
jgi:CRISPR/Cas system-associated protein endoribonuclease Cas2